MNRVTAASRLVVVKIAFDGQAGVWYVDHSDVPGMRAEADTADELMNRIPDLIADLVEENGLDGQPGDAVPELAVEIIASHSTRIRPNDAA
jgi:predicted RNase H-like HicB family nuclease